LVGVLGVQSLGVLVLELELVLLMLFGTGGRHKRRGILRWIMIAYDVDVRFFGWEVSKDSER
jgi:hypothetical protein